MAIPVLERIGVYPVKSLDPVELAEAEIGVHSLPRRSRLPLFGGFYHLTVNVFLAAQVAGKKIRVGDQLNVLGPVDLRELPGVL